MDIAVKSIVSFYKLPNLNGFGFKATPHFFLSIFDIFINNINIDMNLGLGIDTLDNEPKYRPKYRPKILWIMNQTIDNSSKIELLMVSSYRGIVFNWYQKISIISIDIDQTSQRFLL